VKSVYYTLSFAEVHVARAVV